MRASAASAAGSPSSRARMLAHATPSCRPGLSSNRPCSVRSNEFRSDTFMELGGLSPARLSCGGNGSTVADGRPNLGRNLFGELSVRVHAERVVDGREGVTKCDEYRGLEYLA